MRWRSIIRNRDFDLESMFTWLQVLVGPAAENRRQCVGQVSQEPQVFVAKQQPSLSRDVGMLDRGLDVRGGDPLRIRAGRRIVGLGLFSTVKLGVNAANFKRTN